MTTSRVGPTQRKTRESASPTASPRRPAGRHAHWSTPSSLVRVRVRVRVRVTVTVTVRGRDRGRARVRARVRVRVRVRASFRVS